MDDEVLHVVVAVVIEVDVFAAGGDAHPAGFLVCALLADADDHPGALLELIGPRPIDRLDEHHRARPTPLLRELARGHEQRIAVAPDHSAEARLLEPARK